MLGDGIMPVNMPEFRFKVKSYRFMPKASADKERDAHKAGFRKGELTGFNGPWNIGIIGLGRLGAPSLVEIARHKLLSDLGTFYLATSNRAAAEAVVRDARTASGGNAKAEILPMKWDSIDTGVSRQSLETIVENTHICIVAAEDAAKYQELCRKAGIDLTAPKDRNIQTRANLPWINKIAPFFGGYNGMVVKASNLSDSLGYGFAVSSGLDPSQVISLNYVDTMRLRGDIREIRAFLVADGLDEIYPELGQEESEKSMYVYAVGTHNDPYCIIYLDGKRIDHKLKPDSREMLNATIRNWGQEQVMAKKAKGATGGETGIAVAETIARIIDGGPPVSCSVFFDSPIEPEQCYFGVPVVFKPVEGLQVPRPHIIEDQVAQLFTEEGFLRRLEAQRAEICSLRKDGLIKGVIKAKIGDDFGDLYAISGDEKHLNRYHLISSEGNDLHPVKQQPALGIQALGRGRKGKNERICVILNRSSQRNRKSMEIRVLEDGEQKGGIGPIRHQVTSAVENNGTIYAAVRKSEEIVIAAFEFEDTQYTESMFEAQIEKGIKVDGEIDSMCFSDMDGGTLFYSSQGKVYCSGTNLESPRELAETGDIISRLKAFPDQRIVAAIGYEGVYILNFVGADDKRRKKFIPAYNGKADVDIRGGKVRVVSAEENGTLTLSYYPAESFFTEENPRQVPSEKAFHELWKLNLNGNNVFAFSKEGKRVKLRVLDECFEKVHEFNLLGINPIKRYEMIER